MGILFSPAVCADGNEGAVVLVGDLGGNSGGGLL